MIGEDIFALYLILVDYFYKDLNNELSDKNYCIYSGSYNFWNPGLYLE